MVKEVSAVPPSNCRDSSGPGVWGSSADVRSHGQATARVCPRKRGKFTRTLRGSAWINQVRRSCAPDGLHPPRLAYRVYALTGAATPARLDHVSRPEQRPAPRFVGRNGPLAAWRGCAVAPELEFPRELAPWIGTGSAHGIGRRAGASSKATWAKRRVAYPKAVASRSVCLCRLML